MKQLSILVALGLFAAAVTSESHGAELDRVLLAENADQSVDLTPAPPVDDLTYLRRVTVDLIGRIPALDEIREFQSWPAEERRAKVVDKLIADERFADRWLVFYADMLRLRSNAEGGGALMAYVHRAIENDMPYDELARRLIVTNGKVGSSPEVGFVLGDNADPMALASATAQVFMGVRMGCAQCHDHPFDVWTREDFYSLAAYYGKTRRVTSQLTNVVYTTEIDQTTVLWPPEGEGDDADRKPMKPRFPIELTDGDRPSQPIARLQTLRDRLARAAAADAQKGAADLAIEDLLTKTDEKVRRRVGDNPLDALGVDGEATRDLRKIDLNSGIYRSSDMRIGLAEFVTSPRNRYFSRSFVNRVWADLVGRGFVDPVDDFRDDNPPSHPATLDFLADEFIAGGYDLKKLVRMIVTSETYQRSHVDGSDETLQSDMEQSFLATPMRRVLSEALYDSIVTAGHLFDVKHSPGQNEKVYYETVRIRIDDDEGPDPYWDEPVDPYWETAKPAEVLVRGGANMPAKSMLADAGYEVERAIELDFDALLAAKDDEVALDRMRVMSKEELEAMRMQQQAVAMPRGRFIERQVQRVYDDNPQFSSSFRMASPAPDGHFLRVFGQSARAQLGDGRDEIPSMRQALLMLNGRLTNEASRVGELEPLYGLLAGPKANPDEAIRLAYLEILTRQPSADELSEAREILDSGENVLAGMADLRWILLNCNEFRYLR